MLDGFLQRVVARAKPDVTWGASAVARGSDAVGPQAGLIAGPRTADAVAASGADAVAWEWLERQPRVSREDVRQLRVWYSAARASQRVPLVRLHKLIVRLEGNLK